MGCFVSRLILARPLSERRSDPSEMDELDVAALMIVSRGAPSSAFDEHDETSIAWSGAPISGKASRRLFVLRKMSSVTSNDAFLMLGILSNSVERKVESKHANDG